MSTKKAWAQVVVGSFYALSLLLALAVVPFCWKSLDSIYRIVPLAVVAVLLVCCVYAPSAALASFYSRQAIDGSESAVWRGLMRSVCVVAPLLFAFDYVWVLNPDPFGMPFVALLLDAFVVIGALLFSVVLCQSPPEQATLGDFET